MIAGPLFFFYVTIGLCMEFASTTRNLKLGFLRVAHPLTFLCLRSAMSHLTNGSPNVAVGALGPHWTRKHNLIALSSSALLLI
jgi:hypothetical protein